MSFSGSKTASPEPTSPRDNNVSIFQRISNILLRWGVETHGISPIPLEQRVDKRLYQMFFVWFSANFNILGFSTGSAGPAFFSLGLRNSLVILLVVDAIRRGSAIPSILNVISMQGFLTLNCIIGGQTLASVSKHLNATLGIVIIGILSLIVTFCGYRVVHWYESIAWIPNVIVFIVMLGIGGKHLNPSSYPSYPPPSAFTILSFASFIASSVVSWCTMTPDYGVYHNAKASSVRIFLYSYLGFFVSSITAHMLGAAFAAAAPGVQTWNAGFDNGQSVGGLIEAIVSPAGGFGKFLVVVVSLSIPSACAPTMYTFGTSFMTITPVLARVPRYIFVILSEAILIPVAIVGATRFYTTLVDVLSVIGYWAAAFAGIVLTEHFVFRRNDFTRYQVEDWNTSENLPVGVAAIFAFLGAFGIIIPSMSQAWYTGPIAKAGTGDIGVLTGFFSAALLYGVFRTMERRIFPSRQY